MSYVHVAIDASEVLDELSDEQLLAALKSRGRQKEVERSENDRELVTEAYERLRAGERDEALLCLERLLFPRWTSMEKCLEDYRRARA